MFLMVVVQQFLDVSMFTRLGAFTTQTLTQNGCVCRVETYDNCLEPNGAKGGKKVAKLCKMEPKGAQKVAQIVQNVAKRCPKSESKKDNVFDCTFWCS